MRKATILSFLFMVFVATGLFWWWSTLLPKSIDSNGQKSDTSGSSYLVSVYELSGEAVYRKSNLGLVSALVVDDRLSSDTSIRTFDKSHVVLTVGGSQDRIEIGANSEVAILIQDKTVVISLLQGEVYGSFHGEKKSYDYEVSTARLKVLTDNADLVVRAFEKGFQKVEVYRGQATIQSHNKNLELQKDQYVTSVRLGDLKLSKQDVLINTPLSHDRVYRSVDDISDTETEIRTRFAWSGLGTSGRTPKKIEILLGEEADKLEPLTLNESSKPGEVTATLPPGIHYWRLRATFEEKVKAQKGKPTEKSSVLLGPVYKIFVVNESPAQLIEPMGLYSPNVRERIGGVLFRWANPSRLERQFLEVSTDKSFANPILRQPIADNVNNIIASISENGKLYWRISGFRHDSSELITSHISEFELAEGEFSDPEVLLPKSKQVFTTRSLKSGLVYFKWVAAGLTEYDIEIVDSQNKNYVSTKLTSSQLLVPNLPVGKYKFIIRPNGESTPVVQEFEVVEASTIKWKHEKNGNIASLPKLLWESALKSESVYKIIISSFFPVREIQNPQKEFIANTTEFTPDLAEEGLYTATVQGLDAQSHVVSESEPLTFRWTP